MEATLNIIRWKCGCVQMQDEPIFFDYCEGDESRYSDYRLKEYIFDLNGERECIPPFEIVSDEEKLHIFKSIAFQSRQAYAYRQFKSVLKDMVK